MDATGVSRIRERVERFLAEEHPERLCDLRDFMRRHSKLRSDLRSGRRLTKTQAGIDGSVENLIPLLHLRRALQGAPAPLETLRYRCWETGFQSGVELDGRHDFERVLDRWARHGSDEGDLDGGRNEPEDLADAVVRRLRASRFWKLALGLYRSLVRSPPTGSTRHSRFDSTTVPGSTSASSDQPGSDRCRRTSRSRRHLDRLETGGRTAPLHRREERCGATCQSTAPRNRCVRSAGQREWETRCASQG